jgi:transcriptional regulator with XRE-family HTH domain
MDCGTLIRTQRARSELSQRELAKRAATSAAAICLYETGQRIPRVDTLARILSATGATLVIDVSEHLPSRRQGELDAPVFAEIAR